ncbi:hypothetical protein [Marispirochaeta aestuarii]|uniref:hypothetical protein n=1 Tax=Marispirochaeta aestuarii TaxID=1963862 RepID=UPI0029C65854|nr:hypothetical protein [Marispirochaeta aestuarii]
MKIIPIKVNRKSYYLLDEDPIQKNLIFLSNLQPLYYHELTKILYKQLQKSKDENKPCHHIAVQMRTIYGQAIESLFAYIFALLQSPFSIVAWIQKYHDRDLKSLIQEFDRNKTIKYSKLQMLKPGWNGLSETINNFDAGNKENATFIKENFASFWSLLGREYTNYKVYKEYCHIKHGFRIAHGGFKFILTTTEDIKKGKEILSGESDYGAKIYIDEDVRNTPKELNLFSLRETFFNWDIELLYKRIEVISYSINNVISFSKGLNKNDFTKEEFIVPDPLSLFDEAKYPKSGVHTFDIGKSYEYETLKGINIDNIEDYYKEKIINIPKEYK